jgi:hypothetical protein
MKLLQIPFFVVLILSTYYNLLTAQICPPQPTSASAIFHDPGGLVWSTDELSAATSNADGDHFLNELDVYGCYTYGIGDIFGNTLSGEDTDFFDTTCTKDYVSIYYLYICPFLISFAFFLL